MAASREDPCSSLAGTWGAGERPAEIVVNVRCETHGCFASRIAYTSSPRGQTESWQLNDGLNVVVQSCPVDDLSLTECIAGV